MEQRSALGEAPDRIELGAHRAPMSLDELGEAPTIATAVDLFFGDLRLAPRTKKTKIPRDQKIKGPRTRRQLQNLTC